MTTTSKKLENSPALLTEFQAVLESAFAQSPSPLKVVMRLSGQPSRWCLGSEHLHEVCLFGHLSKMGGMPPGVAGVATCRGRPVTMICLEDILPSAGAIDIEPVVAGDRWALVLRREDMAAAILCQSAPELYRVSDLTKESRQGHPSPDLSTDSWRDAAGQSIHELDMPAFFNRLESISPVNQGSRK